MSDCERYVSDNDSDFGGYDDENDFAGGEDVDTEVEEEGYVVTRDTDDGWRSDDENQYESDDEDEKKKTQKVKKGKNKKVDVVEDIEDTEVDEEALLKEIEELELEEEEEEPQELDLSEVSSFNKEIIVVKPENRLTSHVMSKFEQTEITSIRAVQISQFNNCLVDITGLDDPILMAKRELMMRKCPLIIRRKVGELKNPKTGKVEEYYEYWSPNEMQFSVEYLDAM
ncbi:RNA polymerase Rpb6 [Pacmanvirus A23]|uniref:RNA polymerase Rpb6 n=1 Tax=Pacmanvirus A23 TaxID=1932881 RepID=UPI000A0920CD|nr:RNA polymerase Rpb6 [Pacmanvirus A23]SIP85868.1 RNA polymerase Rpb6 [Pacmanvirus A23]